MKRYVERPHSAMIVGATACGKTKFILDLLENEYRNFFNFIILICPTIHVNKTYLERSWLFEHERIFLIDPNEFYKEDALNSTLKFFYENLGKMDDSSVLFIIDDCSAEKGIVKKRQVLSELAFSGRHYNVSTWILSQKYNSILTDFREQVAWMALFYAKDLDSFDEALRENAVIRDLDEKKKMRELLANNKHSKLILINEQPCSYKFIK